MRSQNSLHSCIGMRGKESLDEYRMKCQIQICTTIFIYNEAILSMACGEVESTTPLTLGYTLFRYSLGETPTIRRNTLLKWL